MGALAARIKQGMAALIKRAVANTRCPVVSMVHGHAHHRNGTTIISRQRWTSNRSSRFSRIRRLTADMAIVNDEVYKKIAEEYARNHTLFDSDFADAWFKMVHRSEDHPHEDDLEKQHHFCTNFEFLKEGIVV